MMIAAKYEEVHPPDIHEFSSLTKDTCSVKQILKMKEMLLRVLSFDLTTPTVQTFIEEYAVERKLTKDSKNLAMFISELCLVESVHYINYLPSELAAASVALSRHTLDEDSIWPEDVCTVERETRRTMFRFQIHEDSENAAALDRRGNLKRNRDLKGIGGKENSAAEEKRRVLQHVTDAKLNSTIAAPPNRCPLVQKNVNDVTEINSQIKTRIAAKRKIENALLNRACTLVSSKLESSFPESVLDMSVDLSSEEKTKIQNSSKIEEDPDETFYTEPQYRKYIYDYLLESEHHHRPHPQYMKKQIELNDGMRSILVDWLVSISDEYEFAPDTLHLAVSYVDRFLSKMSVVRTKFQLLGVAAMMIAAKYEEVHPPDIHEFSSLTKDTCSVKQILKMEEMLLRVLSFDLTTPTVQTFIEEYAVERKLTKDSKNLAMFISELCLVESVHYINYLPSELAAASVALSRHTLDEDSIWPEEFENLCNYTLTRLYPVVKMQHNVFEESPSKSLQAVRTKYNRGIFGNVTRFKPRKLL